MAGNSFVSVLGASHVPLATLGDEQCSICLDLLQTRAVTITLCGHLFHQCCLKAAMKAGRKRTCPKCRQQVDVPEEQPMAVSASAPAQQPLAVPAAVADYGGGGYDLSNPGGYGTTQVPEHTTEVPELLPPQLAQFELASPRNRILGRGAHGLVFRINERSTGETWALKVMRRFFEARHLDDLAMHEISVLQTIRHPHIVRAYAHGFSTETHHYLALEYAPFGTLGSLVADPSLTPQVARAGIGAFFLRQIALAMEYLHGVVHIVHRDIKAENVLIFSPSTCKLADFGRSAAFSRSEVPQRHAGTLSHAAPEVLQGHPHCTSADCWSFGVLLHEVVAGVLPFSDTSAARRVECTFHPSLPEDARELLEAIFVLDQAQRLRASEVIASSFLANVGEQLPFSDHLMGFFGLHSESTDQRSDTISGHGPDVHAL